MCGIFGVTSSTSLTTKDKEFLQQASIVDVLRGHHATGLVQMWPNKVKVQKKAVHGLAFQGHFNFKTDFNHLTHSVIGHNRWATVGKDGGDTNAHPFLEKNVVGVHNGTLSHGWQQRLQVKKKTPVDSMGLYRAMSRHGVEWISKRACGGMALVWFDLTNSHCHVIKNNDRPLFYATRKVGTIHKTYYASEEGMLIWLLDRNGIEYDEVESFKDNVLYDITKGEVKEVKPLVMEGRVPVLNNHTNLTNNTKKTGTESTAGARIITPHRITPPPLGQTPANRSTTTSPSDTTLKHINKPILRVVNETPPEKKGVAEGTSQDTTEPEVKQQLGIFFRGVNLPKSDHLNGVYEEYPEVGKIKVTHQCVCCGTPIDERTNYYEEVLEGQGDGTKPDVLHIYCLDVYRGNHSFTTPLMRILRKNLPEVLQIANNQAQARIKKTRGLIL